MIERLKEENDHELLLSLAERAEAARTVEFARKALAGLVLMGLDPEERLLPSRFAGAYKIERVSYLMSVAAQSMPGAPMLRAILEAGADPDAGAKKNELTPLAHALGSQNLDAALALAESGANWSHWVGAAESGLFEGQRTPAQLALFNAPRQPVKGSLREEEGRALMSQWEILCKKAIASLPTAQKAETATGSLMTGFARNGACFRRLLTLLKGAGATALAPVTDHEQSGWPGGRASVAILAARLAGMGEPGRLLDLAMVFPAILEPANARDLLAAVGVGMVDGAMWSQRSGGATPAAWSSLAESLRASCPLRAIELKDRMSVSFASALGSACMQEVCSNEEFKEQKGFWRDWISKAEGSGSAPSARGVAQEMARGAAGWRALRVEERVVNDWPSEKEQARVRERLGEMMSQSPALAEQAGLADAQLTLEWCQSAVDFPQKAKGSAQSRKSFADFMEALARDLERAPGDGCEGRVEKAWESIESACSAEAAHLQGAELARMERLCALAASASGGLGRAQKNAGPRLRV